MEGCSKYCSFCVVPYTRGEEISRPLDDVLTDIAELAAQDVKEITLLGQNVNAYRGRCKTAALPISRCCSNTSRIAADLGALALYHVTSQGIHQRLIESYGRITKLVNHVHLPVQSGFRSRAGGDEARLYRA